MNTIGGNMDWQTTEGRRIRLDQFRRNVQCGSNEFVKVRMLKNKARHLVAPPVPDLVLGIPADRNDNARS